MRVHACVVVVGVPGKGTTIRNRDLLLAVAPDETRMPP